MPFERNEPRNLCVASDRVWLLDKTLAMAKADRHQNWFCIVSESYRKKTNASVKHTNVFWTEATCYPLATEARWFQISNEIQDQSRMLLFQGERDGHDVWQRIDFLTRFSGGWL